MKKRRGSSTSRAFLAAAAASLVTLAAGCTVSEVSRRGTPARLPEPPADTLVAVADTLVEAPPEEASRSYDLEEEMLEEDRLDEDEPLEESIRPLSPDTFRVREETRPADLSDSYGLGYRVQVFASSDRGAAAEQMKIIMAGTGIAAYIEYEDGLYKVRVGDFSTREEASEARAKIAESYPDCWIVRTTIRK